MFPLPRRMLGSAASWENPQVRPLPLPEGLTYVDMAVAIRLFVGFPHQILNSPFACPSLGYTAISGLYIPHIVTLMRHSGVYNLLVQGSIRLELVQNGIQPCYFRGLYTFKVPHARRTGGIQPCYFRVLHTRHRHIQFPEGAGITSHVITSLQSIPASTTTMHLHRRKFRSYHPYSFFGGESGIRTHGCF